VKEINQVSAEAGGITAGDAIGFPVGLNVGGSYLLTSNLLVPELLNGISIDADDVTLDLNGFSLIYQGTASNFTDGILILSHENVEIRGGTVRGFRRHGIFAISSAGVRVIDTRVVGNSSRGMNLEAIGGGGHMVRGCFAQDNGGIGIRILGDGGLALENVMRNNGAEGLLISSNGGYGKNVFSGNNSGGAQVTGIGDAVACNVLSGTVVCPP
jgi:hypothetical protein